MNNRLVYGIGFLLTITLVLGLSVPLAAADLPPRKPNIFYGQALVNGNPFPAGVEVSVKSEGAVIATTETGADGSYSVQISPAYRTVRFFVRGVDTGQTGEVKSGEITELDLTLEDKEGPSIEIREPSSGDMFTKQTVSVEASVSDDLARYDEIDVEVGVEGSMEPVDLDPDGSFSEDVQVPTGEVEIIVTAEDFAGNSTEESVGVTVDSQAPSIDSLNYESQVDSKTTTLTGTITDDIAPPSEIEVRLDGKIVELESDGSFSESLSLTTGSNSFTITAKDEVGNDVSQSITIVSDTAAPQLTIRSPVSGKVVTEETIMVKGTVNDDVVEARDIDVTVDGKTAGVSSDGTFEKEIMLDKGSNDIEITAADKVGNSTSETITVIRDAEKPTLAIEKPEEGLTTTEETVTLSGEVSDDVSDPGAIEVTVDESSVSVQSDGSFSTDVSLDKGSNTITATAKDEAGRSVTATRNVERISPTPWPLYAAIIAVIAVILAALAIWRARGGPSGEGM